MCLEVVALKSWLVHPHSQTPGLIAVCWKSAAISIWAAVELFCAGKIYDGKKEVINLSKLIFSGNGSAYKILRMELLSSNISRSISSLLLQCGDIEKNPGPFPKVFLGTNCFYWTNNSFGQKSCWKQQTFNIILFWQIFNREDPVVELQDLVEDQDEKIRSKSDLSSAKHWYNLYKLQRRFLFEKSSRPTRLISSGKIRSMLLKLVFAELSSMLILSLRLVGA